MSLHAPMTCDEVRAATARSVAGSLSPRDRQRVRAHVGGCASCRADLVEVSAQVGALSQDRPGLVAGFGDGVAGAIEHIRRHGRHQPGRAVPDVSLVPGVLAAIGDHIAMPWSSDREFELAADVLAAGLGEGDAGILVGQPPANRDVLARLVSLGLRLADLEGEHRFLVVAPGPTARAMLSAVDEQIKQAVDRGVRVVRLLGNLTWGPIASMPGDEVLELEARVTDAIARYPAVVVCAYDVRRISARALRKGCHECHPLVLEGGALRASDAFVPADRFLAELGGGAT